MLGWFKSLYDRVVSDSDVEFPLTDEKLEELTLQEMRVYMSEMRDKYLALDQENYQLRVMVAQLKKKSQALMDYFGV